MSVARSSVPRLPRTWTGITRSAGGLPASAAATPSRESAAGPSGTFAPLRSMTVPSLRCASRRVAPLQGSVPYSACGIGKRLSRAYLPRVRCAFGVSRPLDALFLPKPFRTCFRPVTLLGFRPSKVSPSAARSAPSGRTSPPGVGSNGSVARCRRNLARLPGFALRGSPLPSRRKRRGAARSSLGLSPPPGVFLPPRQPRLVGRASSLRLGAGRRQAACHSLPFGVSIAEGLGDLRRVRRPSWGSCAFR
jgi:hypothetical protein